MPCEELRGGVGGVLHVLRRSSGLGQNLARTSLWAVITER